MESGTSKNMHTLIRFAAHFIFPIDRLSKNPLGFGMDGCLFLCADAHVLLLCADARVLFWFLLDSVSVALISCDIRLNSAQQNWASMLTVLRQVCWLESSCSSEYSHGWSMEQAIKGLNPD